MNDWRKADSPVPTEMLPLPDGPQKWIGALLVLSQLKFIAITYSPGVIAHDPTVTCLYQISLFDAPAFELKEDVDELAELSVQLDMPPVAVATV